MKESTQDNKDYLALKEVAEQCGASYGTIKRDIEHGRLPAYRIGRKYFVAKADMENYNRLIAEKKNVAGYTIAQLMEKIPLSYAFLMELIKSKKLPAVKVGRQYIISEETFQQFMEECRLDS